MPATTLIADFQKYNPFAGADWRWRRVLQMCDRYPTPGRCTRRDDNWVRRMRQFLLTWRARNEHEREELWLTDRDHVYAYQIYERSLDNTDGGTSLCIEARLLAGQPVEDIAKLVGTSVGAILIYGRIFFDVGERLDQRDWITRQILIPAVLRSMDGNSGQDSNAAQAATSVVARPFLDGSLLFFAYFGGPFVCDLMISGFQAGKQVRSAEDVGKFLDQQFTATIKRRGAQAAAQFEINKYNIGELFNTYARIMELERSADGVDETGSGSPLGRHIQAMLNELPGIWNIGQRTGADTLATPYQGIAAELRDDELLTLNTTGADSPLLGLEELKTLRVRSPSKPEPTGSSGQG